GGAGLDVGCGEGQYAREIARQYRKVTVVGVDLNPAVIEAARAASAGVPNIAFLVHDARQPVPAGAVPDGGFDVVVCWAVLQHLPDKAAALAHLAAALRPGGALLLGHAADRPPWVDHPDAVRLITVGIHAARQLGLLGLEEGLEPLLRQAGFTDISTAVLRYLAGGATAQGQRWWRYVLESLAAGRRLL